MAHLNQPPVTPEKQLISARSALDLDSPILDDIDCTPNTKTQMRSNKRKASQIAAEGTPKTTKLFLKWRLATVENQLETKTLQMQAVRESAGTFLETFRQSKTEILAELKEAEQTLLSEKIRLLADRKILEQDLNDTVTDCHALEEAYINELRMSLETASSSKERFSGMKTPRLDRKNFKRQLNEYLGTEDIFPGTTDTKKWCNVIGAWLPSNAVTCAHIVPFSFNTKDMAHMFGSDEPPLTSMRNGLSLQNKIEEAFDNCWVTIVPVDSVESNPTEWKIILLNTAEKDKVFFGDQFNQTSQRVWRWRDIDGRKLIFLNNNRPARRFLYMRYTLAWLYAEGRLWNFKEKVPPGEVWASPNKPDGYLRKSILVAMGKKTGDKLPKNLIDAGVFSDPDTDSIVYDEVAGIRITRLVQGHLDGARDPMDKKNEDDKSEGDENQGEMMDDD